MNKGLHKFRSGEKAFMLWYFNCVVDVSVAVVFVFIVAVDDDDGVAVS